MAGSRAPSSGGGASAKLLLDGVSLVGVAGSVMRRPYPVGCGCTRVAGRAGRVHAPAMGALDGRLALVTGASRGIGHEVARGLAAAGATVVLVARDPQRLDAAVSALVEQGLDVVGRVVDVADLAAVRALPAALGPLGAVDVLVNAAGVMSERTAKTLRTSDEEWRRVLGTNLDGAFGTTAALVPGMVERRWGRVVNVSACLGRMSGPGTAGGLAPYRVSKAALNALTKNLSAELGDGRRGVLADAVCPGHCRTDMGGPAAPRSAGEGARTAVWLATREPGPTGLLWEDQEVVPW